MEVSRSMSVKSELRGANTIRMGWEGVISEGLMSADSRVFQE